MAIVPRLCKSQPWAEASIWFSTASVQLALPCESGLYCPDGVALFLAPKIAVPIRTIVAPSAIAASMSSLIPIESVSMVNPSSRRRPARSASLRCGSRCAARPVRGRGMAISPRRDSPGRSFSVAARCETASGRRPAFVLSLSMLTCRQTCKGGK